MSTGYILARQTFTVQMFPLCYAPSSATDLKIKMCPFSHMVMEYIVVTLKPPTLNAVRQQTRPSLPLLSFTGKSNSGHLDQLFCLGRMFLLAP